MSSYTRQQLEEWLSRLKITADAVVDVGGSQLPIASRVASFKAKKYDILDLKSPHKGERPDISWDLNEMGQMELPMNVYDVAFCLEVMEYIWNPVIALENINQMMKENGVLYITFPFVYPTHEPVEFDCLRYTLMGAGTLLRQAGFVVEDVIDRKPRGSLRAFYAVEGMRAAKEVNHEVVGYIIKAVKKTI